MRLTHLCVLRARSVRPRCAGKARAVSIDGTRIAGNSRPEVNRRFEDIARQILAEVKAADEAEDEEFGEVVIRRMTHIVSRVGSATAAGSAAHRTPTPRLKVQRGGQSGRSGRQVDTGREITNRSTDCSQLLPCGGSSRRRRRAVSKPR
jgi:hypothetical protein